MPDKPPPVAEGDELSAERVNMVTDAAFREVGGNVAGFTAPDGSAFRQNNRFPEPYAKAQSDWEENDGDPKVSVKMCDADGTNVRGPAFDVYLPRRRSSPEDNDPDVYTGDVIRWEWDYEGRRVIVGPSPRGVVFGKLDGELTQGGSQTLDVWSGSPLAASGETVTVNDWFLESGASLPDETKCVATWYHGAWYVTTAECPI